MAHGKHKSRDDNWCIGSTCNIPAIIELDGIIVVHRYNLSIVAECMASSLNNCIQVPFVTGCSWCAQGKGISYS